MSQTQKRQLSQAITQKLLDEIRFGRYANESRLPPEIVVSQQMGVSRTLLRDCLAALEREGFISRKHGVGTIINKHVLAVKVRMDLEKEFLEMIQGAGYAARVASVTVERVAADRELAAKLQIQPGDEVYVCARLVTADGKPAVYCKDHVAAALMKDRSSEQEDPGRPIFEFLKEDCGTEVYMDLTEVQAVKAGGELSEILNVPEGEPVLFMDEVGYDFFGKPVLNSKEYYAGGILNHMVLRKKI